MERAREKGAPPLGAYTSGARGIGEGQVGGGGGQRQAGAKGVSTAGTHASSSTRGAGGGGANEYLEGKVGQRVHYPSVCCGRKRCPKGCKPEGYRQSRGRCRCRKQS